MHCSACRGGCPSSLIRSVVHEAESAISQILFLPIVGLVSQKQMF